MEHKEPHDVDVAIEACIVEWCVSLLILGTNILRKRQLQMKIPLVYSGEAYLSIRPYQLS